MASKCCSWHPFGSRHPSPGCHAKADQIFNKYYRVSQDPMLCNEKGLFFREEFVKKPLTFWCSQWTQWVWVEEKNMTSKHIILKGSLGSEYRLFQAGKSLRLFFQDWTLYTTESFTQHQKKMPSQRNHILQLLFIHRRAAIVCRRSGINKATTDLVKTLTVVYFINLLHMWGIIIVQHYIVRLYYINMY